MDLENLISKSLRYMKPKSCFFPDFDNTGNIPGEPENQYPANNLCPRNGSSSGMASMRRHTSSASYSTR